MTYLSVNLYSFEDLRPMGLKIIEIIDALLQPSPEYQPIRFRADLIDRKRNRFLKTSEKNLTRLREELLAGQIRELELSDREVSDEEHNLQAMYEINLYGIFFWLTFTRPSEKLAPSLPSWPNHCQFLLRMHESMEPEVLSDLLALAKTTFCDFLGAWGDIYFCDKDSVCQEHLIGIRRVEYRRDASEDFRTMIIDRCPFFGIFCDTLARDAYFGVFLNPTHLSLLGGSGETEKGSAL